MTVQEVVAKIARGDVYLVPITFREGLTIPEMAALFEARGLGAAAEFTTAASDEQLIKNIDPAARDLEGYLFPDTYSTARHTTASELVPRMVAGFEKALTPEIRASRQCPGTQRSRARDPRVHRREGDRQGGGAAAGRGGVQQPAAHRNAAAMRSHGHLRAAACRPVSRQPDAREHAGRLAVQHVSVRRPPPGPIASPGRASLEAAAHPADAPYLYFVARGDGSHVFAASLEEHNRNVNEYQRRRR